MRHIYIRYNQRHVFHANNYRTPPCECSVEAVGAWLKINNLRYGSRYPSSYLDIFICDDAKAHPVIIYAHGGGFCWGSKDEGDPNAGRNDDKDWYIHSFLKAGYDFVSFDYALAPEYQYPVPIIQMMQVVRFLLGQKEKYRFDMKKIILAGGSAGGLIIGQFANIHTSPAYAMEMGMKPVIEADAIRACLFNSALLDGSRLPEVSSRSFSYMLKKCGQAYFGDKDIKNSLKAKQSDVIAYATSSFPPSFISDGNTDSFYNQAYDFGKRLGKLGVRHETFIAPRDEAILTHGYESFHTKYGMETMDKMIGFLNEIVED